MYHRHYDGEIDARALFAELPADVRAKLATLDFAVAERACPQHLPIARLMREAVDCSPDASDGTLGRANTECMAVNIGLFGGRFDPIHLGHLCAAQDACEQQALDRVVFVLAARTPRKAGAAGAPAKDRLALLRRAIKGSKSFTVSDFELRKGGTSYTIDTVRHFRRRHPRDRLFWIIGSDHLRQIGLWKGIHELVQLVEFIVLERQGHHQRGVPVLPGLRLHRCRGHLLDISSTQLRAWVRCGRPVNDFMPPAVVAYILRKKLYQHRSICQRDALKLQARLRLGKPPTSGIMPYQPDSTRYDNPALYRACGRSGLKLPLLSLGLWHNFGAADSQANSRALILRAFDLGITHFDLANNYGPPPGSAEETFGRVLREDLSAHRDELIVSTKAGYDMWPGPYGEWGSRKYLLASLDQSLRRLGLDYVDIFYSHRPDPDTPLEETMGALAHAVRCRQGALRRPLQLQSRPDRARGATAARAGHALPDPPTALQPARPRAGAGLVRRAACAKASAASSSPRSPRACSPTAISPAFPADARAARDPRFLKPEHITDGPARQDPPARRPGAGARPVAGPNGARLGAAPAGRHLRAHRREQDQPDRGQPRRAQEPRLLPRRTRRASTASSPREIDPRRRFVTYYVTNAGPSSA